MALPHLKIGYLPDGTPAAAVCEGCGVWMPDPDANLTGTIVIAGFFASFEDHIDQKHKGIHLVAPTRVALRQSL
jgi:hypothetical protein